MSEREMWCSRHSVAGKPCHECAAEAERTLHRQLYELTEKGYEFSQCEIWPDYTNTLWMAIHRRMGFSVTVGNLESAIAAAVEHDQKGRE